jgi:FHA domain
MHSPSTRDRIDLGPLSPAEPAGHRVCGRPRIATLLIVFALVTAPASSWAEPKVIFSVKPIDVLKEPGRKGLPPDIEATIIDGPGGVPVDKFTLIQRDSKVPLPPMQALSLKSYVQGSDAISIVVLIEGQQIWIGTDHIATDPVTRQPVPDSEKYHGALEHLVGALEPLSKAGPPGSLGAIMTYGDNVDIRQAMGPLVHLRGSSLGTQQDYLGNQTTNLTSGVTEALSQLRKVSTPRKALLIIGSGTDTAPDQARVALKDLRKQAGIDRVELYGFTYQPELIPDPENQVLQVLIPGVKVANSGATIRNEINGLVSRLSDRFYVVFRGHDPGLGAGLTWDGQQHELEVQVDHKEIDGVDPSGVVLAPVWNPPRAGSLPWWPMMAVTSLISIGLGGWVLLRKRVTTEIHSISQPVITAGPDPRSQQPEGKHPTAMISTVDGAFPVVGWLVPLNGVNEFQTFKLENRTTKIGTAPPSHVVIDDGFMSTDHCEIVRSPQGFQLRDNKSTNGCWVNGRRVEHHDLIDNDLITLGKTQLKFKSIS